MLVFCLSPRRTQPASLKASFLTALGARRLQVSCNFHFLSARSLQGKHSVDNMVGPKKSKVFLIPNCFVCHCNWAISFPRAASQTAGEGLFLNECGLQEILSVEVNTANKQTTTRNPFALWTLPRVSRWHFTDDFSGGQSYSLSYVLNPLVPKH